MQEDLRLCLFFPPLTCCSKVLTRRDEQRKFLLNVGNQGDNLGDVDLSDVDNMKARYREALVISS